MNWDNGLPGMVHGGLILTTPWGFWALVCLIGFLVLRSAAKWIGRTSGEDVLELLSGLMKISRRMLSFLFVCTGAFFVATCVVGMAGKSMESATFLAMFLKLWYWTLVSLCVTCVVVFLLFLVWSVHLTSRWFPWPTCKWIARGAGEERQKDNVKEGEDQQE